VNEGEPTLPSKGPEREIFLVALERMSEQCEPPHLIRECPFSIDLPTGGRGCGEECLKLLAAEDSTHGDDLVLGASGLVARHRSQPPHKLAVNRSTGTSGGERAFDAMETYYRDSSTLPVRRWNTVALMVALREIGLADPDKRQSGAQDVLGDCVAELVRRGFDVDLHLRPYIAHRLSHAIPAAVAGRTAVGRPPQPATVIGRLIAWRDSMSRSDVSSERVERGAERLAQRFRVSPDLGRILEFTLIGDFAKRVQEWARVSSIWELFAWEVAPEMRHDTAPHLSAVTEQDQLNVAIWLFDRFTETYLRDWRRESLRPPQVGTWWLLKLRPRRAGRSVGGGRWA
jgi:hypothetical protein